MRSGGRGRSADVGGVASAEGLAVARRRWREGNAPAALCYVRPSFLFVTGTVATILSNCSYSGKGYKLLGFCYLFISSALPGR